MKKVIEIENLRFQYPSTKNTIPFSMQIDSWSLLKGEMAVLHGPSGCGKSTLLNLISGALPMQKGRLCVLGMPREGASDTNKRAHRIEHIGFVFQDFPLVNYLNALENILLPYRINPVLSLTKDVRFHAKELLGRLGLEGKENRLPQKLSQGERQRVAIARALITKPQLFLADEPTAGLDPERAESVMTLLEELVRERENAMLVVTHDPIIKARFSKELSLGDASC